MYSHCLPDGHWLPGGASNSGGEVLHADFPGADLASLDDEAAVHGPAQHVAYPLRRVGERFPIEVPDARGFVLGEPRGQVDRYRGLLEGVAFVERLGYERLAASGVAINGPVVGAGAGSESDVWARVRATVLGRPIRVTQGAVSVRGAAMLAACGTVQDKLADAVDAMGGSSRLVSPVPAEAAPLEESYQRFASELHARGWLPPDVSVRSFVSE